MSPNSKLRIFRGLFRIEEIQKKHTMEKYIEFFTSRSGTGSRPLNIFLEVACGKEKR